MSFGLNKPSDPAAPYTVRANVARRATQNPAFKPEFARSLRMHPLLAGIIAAVVLALIAGYALHARPAYEAESLIYVEPAAIKALSADAGTFDSVKYDTYIQQQILTAGRRDIVAAALQTLPRATWQAYGDTLQAAANRLQSDIKIQRAGSSYQLSFTLRGIDPIKTADTLNAIVKTYLATGRKDELAQSDMRTQILLEERQRIESELSADKAEQAQLSAILGMANPGLDAGNAYDEQLTSLRSQIAGARENHEIAAAQLAAVSGQDSAHVSGLTAAADDQVNADPALTSMRSAVGQRRATLVGQMAGLTPENPIFKQDQEELNDLDRQLAAATQTSRDQASRRLQDKLRTDLARTGDIESRLNAQLAQQTSTATSASPKLQRAAELNADLHRLTTRYASVDDALRSLQLDSSGPGLAHLALAATPPLLPAASRMHLLLLAALPLALLCGLFAAVFARKRDHHIYTGPDLEYVLGFTPIAVLPAVADVSPAILREYMLRLAAGVEGAYRNGNARTFVVTAAGASTDIPALTRSVQDRLAALGLTAASVTATEILDPGFASAGAGTTALQPHYTSDGRNEGFAAGRLDLLKAAHDLIFIQAPAILTSAETEYVVRLADATILVAESGLTTRGDLLQAALLLERLNARGIGAVLDNLDLRNADPVYLKAIRLLEKRQFTEPQTRAEAARTESPATDAPPVANQPVTAHPVAHPVSEDPREAEPITQQPLSTPSAAEPSGGSIELQPQESSLTNEEVSAPESLATPQPSPTLNAAEPLDGSLAVQSHEAVLSIAGTSTPALSSRKPLAIPTSTQPEAPNWLSRLLHRDAAPVVSIIPTEDDQESDEPLPLLPVNAPSLQPSLDILPQAQLHAEPAPQPVSQSPTILPEIVEHPLPEAAYPIHGEQVSLETIQSSPEPVILKITPEPTVASTISAVADQPVFEPSLPEPSLLEPVKREPVKLEPAQPEGVSEPAASQIAPEICAQISAPLLEPLPAEVLFVSHPAPVEPVASPIQSPIQELAQTLPVPASAADPINPETSLSFRTARMDVEPARRNSGPWRDRRVAGSDAHIHPSQDRRFNWAARAAEAAARSTPPAVRAVALPPEPASAPAPRPHLVPREANLTRKWGLLSQYSNVAPDEGTGKPEDSPREYRRG